MRIIYLHQYFNTPDMPGGTRSYEMARRLVAAGHEVHMVTTWWRDVTEKHNWFETVEAGIHVHWLPVLYSNDMTYRDRIVSFLRFAFSSARKAASLHGDVIFATSTPLTIALPGIYASLRTRIPMVFEVRDLWPEIPVAIGALKSPLLIKLAQLLELAAYRFSKHIVALSPGMKDGVVKTGYPQEKVTIIPNSCDMDLYDVPKRYGDEFRSRYDWLGDRPLVTYAGALGFINGVGYLVQLAKRVLEVNSEIRFLVVCKGKEGRKIKEMAEAQGILNKNFFMMSEIPKKEMPYVLSATDITTSLVINLKVLWDNSANKFFDSLAAGRPIAINHDGWQADLLRKTGAGLVLDPTDLDKSANILLQAIKDKVWLEKAGLAAKRLARDEFSRDMLAQRLEALLRSAANKNRNI